MILTKENWSTGREKLYSVGGRWINGYGALVEWYWQGKTEVLGEKHYIVWVEGELMDMEHWWNGTERGKLKYWERKCHWLLRRWTGLFSSGCQWLFTSSHTEHMNAVLFNGTPAGGTYSNHWAVEDDAQYLSKPQYCLPLCHKFRPLSL